MRNAYHFFVLITVVSIAIVLITYDIAAATDSDSFVTRL